MNYSLGFDTTLIVRSYQPKTQKNGVADRRTRTTAAASTRQSGGTPVKSDVTASRSSLLPWLAAAALLWGMK